MSTSVKRVHEDNTNNIVYVNFGKGRKQRNVNASSPLQTTGTKKEPVEPIKSKKDIKKMKNILRSNGKYGLRNWLIFVLGINIGLRCSDIVRFRFCDVLDAVGNIVKDLTVCEQKTGKLRYTPLNTEARNALRTYIDSLNGEYEMTDYLFPSNKKSSPHLQVGSVRDILKEAAAQLEHLVRIGSHSMRKTFAYHFFMGHKDDNYALSNLQDMLNHASLRDTLRYIGLDRITKRNLCESLNL